MATTDTIFDLADDFSILNNPNGTWQYGYSYNLTEPLTLYTNNDEPFEGIQLWRDANEPGVLYNATDQTYIFGSLIQPAQTASFHPGPNGEYSFYRWSAPTIGEWNIDVIFQGFDKTTTDVHVLLNGSSLFAGDINGYQDSESFTQTLQLSEGDVIDFAVGNGGNGHYWDTTGIDATISLIPSEPVNKTGTSGKDTLEGTNFNDTLSGLGGNDTLDGRGGIDSLIGGKGNDTYIVDNSGDIVKELAGEGTDLVKSSANYKLPDNVENLTLTGNENLTGKGNQLNNKITGNTKNDRLFGYGGNDNLNGGAGNDSLFGGAGTDILTGGTGNDYLSGGVGKDNLTGGTGQDILSGGTGQDNFIFLNPNEGLDIITDFSPTDDTLQIKASAFAFNSIGAIAPDQLVTGEQAIAASAPLLAIDNNDYFIYDDSTGILSFDSDGNGGIAPVPLVMLDNIPAITNADLVLF